MYKTKIHLISGLGADRRAFENLQLNSVFEKNYIEWIKPAKSESIGQYAQRLIKFYHVKDGDIILGLSFGGITAIEMNKFLRPATTILISSVTSRKELSVIFKIIGNLKLHKLISKKRLVKPNPGNYYLFDTKTQFMRDALDMIIREADPDFLEWAIDAMLCWKQEQRIENLIHIHGDKDKVFPFKKNHADFIIKNGTHLMVFDRAEEVSEIVNHLLENHT